MTNQETTWDELLNSNWFKYLVIAALVSGGGGSIASLGKDTSDRFKRAEFNAYKAEHDNEEAEREREIAELQEWRFIHGSHSAQYSEIIRRLDASLKDHLENH